MPPKKFAKNLTALTLTLLLLFTGCWDKVEIENRAFVSAVGIDSFATPSSFAEQDQEEAQEGDQETKDPPHLLKFDTNRAPTRFVATASLPGRNGEGKALTSASDALIPALAMISLGTSQHPYYGQTKAIVLGEGLLQDPLLLTQTIDALERNYEISRKVIMLSCEGNASDILLDDIHGEQPGMYISNFYTDTRVRGGLAFKKDLENVLRDLRSTGGTVIPRIAVYNGQAEFSGAALIRDYNFAGWLNDCQVRGLLLAKGLGKNAHITVDFGGARVPLRITSQRARLKFSRQDGGLVCTLTIRAKGSIEEYRSDSVRNITSPENITILNTLFAKAIDTSINNAHARLQDANIDALGLLDHLRKFHYDLYKEFIIDKRQTLQDITFLTDTTIKITNTGSTQ